MGLLGLAEAVRRVERDGRAGVISGDRADRAPGDEAKWAAESMGGGRRSVSRGRSDSSRRADFALLDALTTSLPRVLRAWSRKVRESTAIASATCSNPSAWASTSRAVRAVLRGAPAAAPAERVPDEASLAEWGVVGAG